MTGLPARYSERPLTLDDAAAVHAIVAAEELRDIGRVDSDLEDILGQWQRPSVDLGATTVGIEHDGRLVGPSWTAATGSPMCTPTITGAAWVAGSRSGSRAGSARWAAAP